MLSSAETMKDNTESAVVVRHSSEHIHDMETVFTTENNRIVDSECKHKGLHSGHLKQFDRVSTDRVEFDGGLVVERVVTQTNVVEPLITGIAKGDEVEQTTFVKVRKLNPSPLLQKKHESTPSSPRSSRPSTSKPEHFYMSEGSDRSMQSSHMGSILSKQKKRVGSKKMHRKRISKDSDVDASVSFGGACERNDCCSSLRHSANIYSNQCRYSLGHIPPMIHANDCRTNSCSPHNHVRYSSNAREIPSCSSPHNHVRYSSNTCERPSYSSQNIGHVRRDSSRVCPVGLSYHSRCNSNVPPTPILSPRPCPFESSQYHPQCGQILVPSCNSPRVLHCGVAPCSALMSSSLCYGKPHDSFLQPRRRRTRTKKSRKNNRDFEPVSSDMDRTIMSDVTRLGYTVPLKGSSQPKRSSDHHSNEYMHRSSQTYQRQSSRSQ